MSFVHLHVHTQYSLLEAAIRIKDLAEKAKSFEMPAVAITDNGNMFGAVEFYFACKSAGVKPLIGIDAYLAPKSRHTRGEDLGANRRIVLLAQSLKGYQNLCQISTKGFQEGFYYKPRVDYEVLKEFSEDVIALTGGLKGEIPHQLLEQGQEKALEKIRELKEIFSDRLYLEVCKTGREEWTEINSFMKEASQIAGVPIVAGNDVHYLTKDDALAQEVLFCIGTNKTLQDVGHEKGKSQELYFKGPEQMRKLFADMPEAADRTLEIADRCKFDFKLKDEKGRQIYHLPTYPTEAGRSLKEEMRALSEKGLTERFIEAERAGEGVPVELRPDYQKRLDYELKVIDEMGFNGYFLIVQDFIGWAKRSGIPVGPGRGSGAGSLVAYSLKITDLDPIPNKLIFERFLNPERISMPDFDIDFCQDRRGEVIKYVTGKYGSERVSQIITFGKLQARAAVRDVGRVMGMTFQEVDVVAKLIPEKLGITLADAIETEPRLRELMDNEPRIATLMDLAQRVEGMTRHASIHAAGVVIADKPLVQHSPLYKGVDGENVIQFDMKMAEKIGLIKFDFLGLKTLTLIFDAFQLIKKNRGKELSVSEISLKDPGIYEIMSRGNTAGIFQFEGSGISDLIKKVRPTCFEDITAINALYRPGPMQMLDEYIGRKHGKIKVSYMFPELEEILKETYGIIVYQEQVQLIAARVASYSLGEADMLRRAMGKKIASEMAQQKTRFMDGALRNGFASDKAEELFELMAKFAEYGFNKSHAAAYCVVAAQTAWLKNYYPVEFYAALLSTEVSDTDKVVQYVKDARRSGLTVRPPHVNFSDFKFSVAGDEIFFGLGAIKGVGESAVEAILEPRAAKPERKFESLEDFFVSVDLRRVNKKVIECLIKAGALDEFGFNRAEILASYSQFVEASEKTRRDRELGQGSLFDMESEEERRIEVPRIETWAKTTSLAFEKEVLGFYLSDHPLSGLEGVLGATTSAPVAELGTLKHKQKVIVGGILSSLREMITRKGTRMAFGQLEDLTGMVEVVVFPDVFAKSESVLKSDGPILIEGTLELDEGSAKIISEKILMLADRTSRLSRVRFQIDQDFIQNLDTLKHIISAFPGQARMSLELEADQRKVLMEIEEPNGLNPSREFFEKIQGKFGSTSFIRIDA